MYRLFQFIYKYRSLLFFLLLEIVCFWLVVQNNQYQRAAFFSSSNVVASTLMSVTSGVSSYFSLKVENEALAQENARLRELLERQRQSNRFVFKESRIDYEKIDQFVYTPANVINKSLFRFTNYLTIDKGTDDGLEAGMAVISKYGVVGKVKASSNKFATVISLLHSEFLVSSVLKRSGALCTTKWSGATTNEADLLYLPRHVDVQVGDTIITSGYNSLFPQGILVGKVRSASLGENEPFHEVTIELSTDFDNLQTVYVIKNKLKQQIDSLEAVSVEGYGE